MKEYTADQCRIMSCNYLIKKLNKEIKKSIKEGTFEAQFLCGAINEDVYEMLKNHYSKRGFTIKTGSNRYGYEGVVITW